LTCLGTRFLAVRSSKDGSDRARARNAERKPSRQLPLGTLHGRVCRPVYLFLTLFFNPHFISNNKKLPPIHPGDSSVQGFRPPSARGRRAWRRRATSSVEREPHEKKPRECLRARRGMASRARVRRARPRKAGEVISASSSPPPCHQASNARTQQTLAVRLGCRRGFHNCATLTPYPSTSSPSSTLLPRPTVAW
jgi:hypothetical protein